jgi:O-Antigen ligase
VTERDERHACFLDGTSERPVAVSGHTDVEDRRHRREKIANVGLRSAYLGERDHVQQARTLGHQGSVLDGFAPESRSGFAVALPGASRQMSPAADGFDVEREVSGLIVGSGAETPGVDSPASSSWRMEIVGVLPTLVALGLGVFLAADQGGYSPTVWYPAGLFIAALIVTLVIAVGTRSSYRAAVVTPLALFGGFTVWSYATILWASARADAWDGANRTLLYFLVLVFVALCPLTLRAAWLALFAFVVAATTLGVASVVLLVHSGDVESYTVGGRLSAPFGYPNATAAFFMIAAWCALGLASRPWLRPPVRGCALGLGVVLIGLNLLSASRGSIFTLPAIALTYFVLVPGRLRSLAMGLVLTVGVAPVVGPAFDVYRSDATVVPSQAGHALVLMLVAGSAVAAAGAILAVLEGRIRLAPERVRTIGMIVAVATVLGGAGTIVAIQPWSHVHSAWHSFKDGSEPGGATHFGGLGSNRYDFWRVGLDAFRQHPVAGIGADNFLVQYIQARRSKEQPLYPHSLWVRVISQTGVIGALLFLGFLAAAARAVARASESGRDLAAIAFVGFSVWIWHGLVDWLWEMPALGVVAVGLLGLALAVERSAGSIVRRRWSWRARGLGAAVTLVVVCTLALPWLAERDVEHAGSIWSQDPSAAFSELDRARNLNPLSDRADLVAGAIAARLGRYDVMRDAFQRAVRRSPSDWYATLELGVSESLVGDRPAATAAFARAISLNPGEPLIQGIYRRFQSNRPLDPVAIDRALSD